ncbi:hypothetical protein J437_LFUL001289, partial [Ladona fulva]
MTRQFPQFVIHSLHPEYSTWCPKRPCTVPAKLRISWERTSGNRVEVRRGKGGSQTFGWPGLGFRKHRGCGASVAFAKKHNVKHHFQTNHGTFATNYPENPEIRKNKVCELKPKPSAQQSVFARPISKSKNATTASFKIAHLLAKKKKPFQGGELLKEAFLACAESLFGGLFLELAAIQELQLSDSTVLRRIEAIADDMQSQLKRDVETCEWFSLQFPVPIGRGENGYNTDISDRSQLAVIIRILFDDFTVKEELLKILPLKKRTRGEDIYNVFKTYAAEIGLPLKKLSAITPDGSPAMDDGTNGFVALCKKDECFPNFVSYQCIIHQEALCTKILPFGHVMDVVTSIINFIRAAPLQHQLFKALLEDSEDKTVDLILHAEVRWLSRGEVPSRFLSLIEKINELMQSNPEKFRKDKDLAQMIGSVEAFKAKLTLWMSQMRSKSLVHFPNMKKMTNVGNFEPSRFTGHLKKLLNQFEKRFQLPGAIAHATDVGFWKLVEKDRFPLLRSVAYKIKSCFGSTYLCESLFSTMNIIKSKNRNRLTDSHLDSCLRAGTSVLLQNFVNSGLIVGFQTQLLLKPVH